MKNGSKKAKFKNIFKQQWLIFFSLKVLEKKETKPIGNFES